jgi:Zn-dependent protease with chaperone function
VSISDIKKSEYWMWNYATNDWKTKTSIWDSHPSIDDRIEKLQNY